jgi:signal transduction histidine kinase
LRSQSGDVGRAKHPRANRVTRPRPSSTAAREASSTAELGNVALLHLGDVSVHNPAFPLLLDLDRPISDVIPENGIHSPNFKGDRVSDLVESQEIEREAIARELHDNISQRLSMLEMLLSEVDLSKIDPQTCTRLHAVRSQIEGVNEAVRQISHRIYPVILNDLGLPAAIRSLAVEFEQKHGIPVTFIRRSVADQDYKRVGLAIYRIACEALENAARHAGPTPVIVALKKRGKVLELKVSHSGRGFDTASKSRPPRTGLLTIQERARNEGGMAVVQSSTSRGTVVTVTIPLE